MNCDRMVAVSSVPSTRSARPKARRFSASSRHSSTGCSHAPRPGRVADGSTTSSESWATILRREDRGARERHPTHVLTGSILLLPTARAERTGTRVINNAVECNRIPTGRIQSRSRIESGWMLCLCACGDRGATAPPRRHGAKIDRRTQSRSRIESGWMSIFAPVSFAARRAF